MFSIKRSPLSPKELEARRANARKSTGPRTPEGKSRVALSALRHGLHAADFLSAMGKSSRASQEYRGLYLALYAALLPDKTDETAVARRKATVAHARCSSSFVIGRLSFAASAGEGGAGVLP